MGHQIVGVLHLCVREAKWDLAGRLSRDSELSIGDLNLHIKNMRATEINLSNWGEED